MQHKQLPPHRMELLINVEEGTADIFSPVGITDLRILNRCHPGLIEFGYFKVELTAAGKQLLKEEKAVL